MDPEDQKLVTLARSAYGRALVTTWAPAGAAVRDEMGRTYVAASVQVDGASVTALQLAVATALSSGARSFEAACVVSDEPLTDDDGLTAFRAYGAAATVISATPDGTVRA